MFSLDSFWSGRYIRFMVANLVLIHEPHSIPEPLAVDSRKRRQPRALVASPTGFYSQRSLIQLRKKATVNLLAATEARLVVP